MDLKYNHITCKKISGTTVVEHPIENDYILSDQMPDMDTVLQTETSACIMDVSVHNNKLRLEGLVTFEIIYRDAQGFCHGTKSKVPFSKTVDVRSDGVPYADVTVAYMNYRMINERRMDIRGNLTVKINYCTHTKEEYLAGCSDENVCLLQESFNILHPVATLQKRMTVREDLQMTGAAASMDHVIAADIYVDVQDHKIIAGKAVVKGTLYLNCLLANNDGAGTSIQHSVPFSQILDGDGVEDGDICCCLAKCSDFSVTLDDYLTGKVAVINANLMIRAEVHREISACAVTDLYATDVKLSSKEKKVEYVTAKRWLQERLEEKCTIKISEPVTTVLFVRCFVEDVQVVQNEKGNTCKISYHTVLYYLNEESLVCTVTKKAQAEYTLSDKTDALGDVFVSVSDVSYVLDSSGAVAQVRFTVTGNVLEKHTRSVLTEIQQEELLPCTNRSSMILAFGKKGESFWDIGKRYHVSAERIMEENNCKKKVLDCNKALLIPVVSGIRKKAEREE